ncbi:RIP metalloprotease RseP [Acinetobacter qingfengensis]|uniref:Zinc metalloprotease n=1 Tax=Acinetobacter qingfengensis TaxID=1262585 RepID=A0A1E7RE11_9GAMM|nr:RIP metalloprotease RseP [Acinetobacter qingfengensis]KAA8734387.1 RIP metalloprotease RseP [Acinetobacter qingfengensis]OEY97604.1 RIP metalloprotease RseP [Acinetobacter qingfengensis]
MNILFIIVAAILLLGPLIAIHEFGHYWVARRMGVKVLVYSIGFGPKIFQWTSKKSGIQYRLAALPFGGYVRMLDEREGNVPEDQLHLAFNRQSVWKRFAIVAAGPLINLLLAVILFWILYLPASEQLNTRIGKVIPQTPAAQVDLRVGDKITAIDQQATPTWEKLNYTLLERMGETGTVTVEVDRAGQILQKQLPIKNFIQDQNQSALQSLGFMPYQPKIKPIIGQINADGAAARQGMKVGDEIGAINGQAVNDWLDAVEIIRKSPEKLLSFTILRQGQIYTLEIMPQAKKDSMGNVTGMIGAGIQAEKFKIPSEYALTVKYTPLEAFSLAIDKTWQLSTMTVNGIVKMIRGLIGLDNISGPITIAKVAGQSAEMGWQTFLSFMALMSVSLGVLNLLPIPMLDGGHLVYYLIEALRGRPVSEQVQLFGLKIGMALLGTMMLLALFNDIMRF